MSKTLGWIQRHGLSKCIGFAERWNTAVFWNFQLIFERDNA